ncbi:hypothetical protein [Psychromonas sp. L1A2]|nr:hypothetical protein [Psychromonas sp. L1A2]
MTKFKDWSFSQLRYVVMIVGLLDCWIVGLLINIKNTPLGEVFI